MRSTLPMLVVLFASVALGDGPGDNDPAKVRPVPPVGIELDAETVGRLTERADAIDGMLPESPTRRDDMLRWKSDVRVLTRAVRNGVKYREFMKPADVKNAEKLLDLAERRAREVAAGKPTWQGDTGRVVHGFVSRLDDTVQPYGLVVPESYEPGTSREYKLDVWLHGRGERSLENQFLWQRLNAESQYEPKETFVLHPYGRYSNAFKFAGEVDVLEAIEEVAERYPIDRDRVAIRGFSMGGAGCWQLAVHYPDMWYAANPGAGFSETPEFLRTFQGETLNPTPWERALWQWYDCPVYAVNLAQCPTIAYSGEIDRQKQAADLMESVLEKEGIDLVHLVGPKTGHKIHAGAKEAIQWRMDALAERGRERVPQTIHFATPTLRYDQSHWLRLTGLERHWTPARVDAELHRRNRLELETKNVTAVEVSLWPGEAPFDLTKPVNVEIDGRLLVVPPARSDRSFRASFVKHGSGWHPGEPATTGLRKQPGLQGPIDDAFLKPFTFVRPTGKFRNAAVEKWVKAEMERAVREWRRHFRGDVRVVDDTEIGEFAVFESGRGNLVLWGDPSSNKLLAEMIDDLPIEWKERLSVGDRRFAEPAAVPLLVYPNPISPNNYVVLNSGPTYREYAYLNNARQVPMLPDWAVVDAAVENDPAWPRSRWPGRILAADFFDEEWRVTPADVSR